MDASGTETAREMLEVTQADRDAAAPWVIVPENSRKIRDGEMDWNPMVQAFARHRLASPSLSFIGEIGELVRRLREDDDLSARLEAAETLIALTSGPDGEIELRKALEASLTRLRDSQEEPDGQRVSVDFAALCDVLIQAHDFAALASKPLPPTDDVRAQTVEDVAFAWTGEGQYPPYVSIANGRVAVRGRPTFGRIGGQVGVIEGPVAAVTLPAAALVELRATLSAQSPPPADDAEADLVARFSAALLAKLRASEAKYGWQRAWTKPDWQDELPAKLLQHVHKGDPIDVAAYAAFAWHHGWSVSPPPIMGEGLDAILDEAEEAANALGGDFDSLDHEALASFLSRLSCARGDAPSLLEGMVGKLVRKVKGLPFGNGDARVVAEYGEGAERRVVVKHREGWQHIFSPDQLEIVATAPALDLRMGEGEGGS